MKLRSIVDVQIAPDGTARRLRRVDAEPSQERTRGGALRRRRGRRNADATRRNRPHLQHPDAPAAAPLVARRLDAVGDRHRRRTAGGDRHSAVRRGAGGAHEGAGRGVHVRVVAGRQEPRVPHARSDAARRGAPAAGQVVRHPRGRAGSSDAAGAGQGRPAVRDAHADAADRLRRRAVVVARRPRDRVLGGAAHRLHRRLRRARLRGRARRRRAPDDRRSRRDEHRPALLARRPLDRVHLDQRPQRHHGVAQSDRRAGGRRNAARLRAGRCVGERVRVGARQPVDLPAGQRRHVRQGRAHVRAADRAPDRRRRQGDAPGLRSDGRVFDQPQRRRRAGWPSSRSAPGRWATWR